MTVPTGLAQWVVVPKTLPSMERPPIGFAHRGARADAPENTLEAFRLARRLGAMALESDVWLTSDGVPVLDHDGVVGKVRRRPIASVPRAELPDHIPSLAELYDEVGTDVDLSLDIKDAAAFDATVAVAAAAGQGALPRLWLCHPDWELVEWDLPAELFERRHGAPICHDDLIDFHRLLQDDGWFDSVVASS